MINRETLFHDINTSFIDIEWDEIEKSVSISTSDECYIFDDVATLTRCIDALILARSRLLDAHNSLGVFGDEEV